MVATRSRMLATWLLAGLMCLSMHATQPAHAARGRSRMLLQVQSPSASPPAALLPPGMPDFFVPPMMADYNVSACTWNSIFGTCRSTDNYFLRASNVDTFKNATFAGRAYAFTVAANAYCRLYPRNNCQYPCQDNGEVCALNGALSYGMYACDNSLAHQDAYCMLAPLSESNTCASTPACIAHNDTRPSRQCVARFRANLTSPQLSGYLSDWGTIRRRVWGCCQGSEARFMRGPYCDQYSSNEGACKAQPGCIFQSDATCAVDMNAWFDGNIADRRYNYVTRRLQDDYTDCPRYTTEAECGSRTYLTKRDNMNYLLKSFAGLRVRNRPVPDAQCSVWN